MKRFGKLMAAVLAVFILLAGCAEQQEKTGEPSAPDLKAVLKGEEEFYNYDLAKPMSVNSMTLAEGTPLRVQKFTVLDLDADGTSEAVLWLGLEKEDDYGFAVLHVSESRITGYVIPYRGFNELKTDGTYISSDSADHTEVLRLTLDDRGFGCQHNTVDISLAEQDAKPDAPWYAFTAAEIDRLLS